MTRPEAPELESDLAALATFSAPGSGVTRLAWSEELRSAYDWLGGRCEAAGLAWEIDAAGNFLARWEAGRGPAVMVGSHLDSVPEGGRYDGALGVLAGLEAIRALRADGFTPARPIGLVAFMDEENTRFNTALYGSRAFCGEALEGVATRTDADGVTLAEAMARWDRDPADAHRAEAIGDVWAFVELHAEQGPRLEHENIDIGVVTSIVAMTAYRVHVSGQANHAGTTPMNLRRDALAGAARMALAVREAALADAALTTNVGRMSAFPGSSNVIPGRADFTIDLRAPDDAALDRLDQGCVARLREIAAEEGLRIDLERVYAMPSAPMDDAVTDAIRASAHAEGATHVSLASGAGHDAMVLSRHVPTGMIFVPSRDGVSHNPDEFTAPSAAALGSRVLAGTLRALAS